ncbi:MAG: PH domain-containing protein [Patescibacteria group bacterium]|nr:PH domain-containing protein [Patescibacteria group bacterium]
MPDVFVNPKKNTAPVLKAKPVDKEQPKMSFWQKIKQPLMAYMVSPSGMHFESQEKDEEVVLLLRRHLITNFPWLTASFLMFIAPPVIFPLLSFFNPMPPFPLNFQFIFVLFWYVLTFGTTLMGFLNWYFNVYIVTNERIVDVDFINLLYRQISSTRIVRVQDVTYKVGGMVRAVFDYGDVYIQTAGTEENFEFEAVPHPEMVTKKLLELMEKKEEGQKDFGGV